jgi:hypothetical protein
VSKPQSPRSDWNLHDAFDAGIHSNQITFWTAVIREVIPRHRGDERVLEVDSWDAGFLRLLHQMRPFGEAVGVSDDDAYRETAASAVPAGEPIAFLPTSALEARSNYFDIAFSIEPFSFVSDLTKHASSVMNSLRDGGEYYAAFGSHVENPLWPHRRRLLREEGVRVYDYSLEEVADSFHAAGFEVGVKRLPVDYFNIYDPTFTRRRALSLKMLVDTTYEHKMLFYFRRDDEVRSERAREP